MTDSDSKKNESEEHQEGEHSNVLALGVIDEMQLLWADMRGLVADHVQLFTLELQRAGESLVIMLICAVFIGVLLVSAWIGLSGVLVLWLIHSGIFASFALLIAVAVNLLGVVLLVAIIRHRSGYLRFPASIESFKEISTVKLEETL